MDFPPWTAVYAFTTVGTPGACRSGWSTGYATGCGSWLLRPASATTTGAKRVVIALLDVCTRLRLIWADAGYDGAPLTGWVRSVTRPPTVSRLSME